MPISRLKGAIPSACAFVALVAATLFTGVSTSYADGPSDWPMGRHDPGQTGYNSSETTLRPPLRLKWSVRTPANYIDSEPIVADGMVLVGSLSNASGESVFALDADTGATKWTFGAGGQGAEPVAVDDGVVYVLSARWYVPHPTLYALDAATGNVKWSSANTISCDWMRSAIVADGVVFVPCSNGLYTLDAVSGDLKWTWPHDSVFVAAANGVVYVSGGWAISAVDAATGSTRWTQSVRVSSLAAANGTVYIRSVRDQKVNALDANTGSTIWTYTTLTSEYHYNIVVADGMVYGSDYGSLFALDAATGAVRWRLSRPATLLAVANGLVYSLWSPSGMYDMYGNLYGQVIGAFDATSGELTWSSQAPGFGGYEHPVVAGGTMYVAPMYSGYVVARDTQPPPVYLRTPGDAVNSTSVALSWSPVAGWTGVQASAYDVQYRDGASGVWSDLFISTTITSTVFSGQDGHIYDFKARSRTAAGGIGDWSDTVHVAVDLVAPTGSLSILGGATYASSITATLVLSATDTTSGVADVSFSNDGVDWEQWQSFSSATSWLPRWPLAAGPDGARTVYARFRDLAGNVSATYFDSIILDTALPSTPSPDDNLSGTIVTSTVNFSWPLVSDALSGVESYYYKVDCGPETATTALSAVLPSLFDGSHTFYLRARDQAGNYSPYGTHGLTVRATSLSAPTLTAPDSPTTTQKINIGGTAPAGAAVRLYANCAYAGQTQAGSDGAWRIADVPLDMGDNVLAASTLITGTGLSPISVPAVAVRVKAITSSLPHAAAGLLTAAGGTVSTGKHAVQIGAGTLVTDTQVMVTPYGAEAAPSLVGKASVGAFASLVALDRATGAPAQLQKPVTVTLSYDLQSLGVITPTQPAIQYYDADTASWTSLASLVDIASKTVSAQTSHLSDFALLAELPRTTYLGVMTRASSGW